MVGTLFKQVDIGDSVISVGLFRDVKNALSLRKSLMEKKICILHRNLFRSLTMMKSIIVVSRTLILMKRVYYQFTPILKVLTF